MQHNNNVKPFSLFTDLDIYLFKSGKHYNLYEKMGSHVLQHESEIGTYFSVWAPNAKSVSVIGNFNYWNRSSHKLSSRWDSSGIWEGFIPNIGNGEVYKYAIETQHGNIVERGDPYALRWEEPPRTASIIWDTWYEWTDKEWIENRKAKDLLKTPISVYEVHLGSWQRDPSNPERFLSYREIANSLVSYVKDMNFTHVEFLPIMEHPFSGSWGYQVTGFFAPSSRFGTPQDFMYLIETLHNEGIGVYLDWVPSHFPYDSHGIFNFDGTHLYEHSDPKQGFHPDWGSYIFNYGRNEVRSFLISSALFWLNRFHADGLRVDAVASMLYLDYSRKDGEWIPNKYGGKENLDAIEFLKELNIAAYQNSPGTQIIAEESTSWPKVSRPVWDGGLGFGMKWMMGWMNDTLRYFSTDPIYRKYHRDNLTFSSMYVFSENFMLPISHDEVVHGKGSLINKMPGDEWQKFANLRTLYGYMFTHPGTKLLFMGCEFAQYREWNHDQSLDWHLCNNKPNKGIQNLVRDLNHLYRDYPALHQNNFTQQGFEWIDLHDIDKTIMIYQRKADDWKEDIVIVLNMSPISHSLYRIGMPHAGTWKEILNTDNEKYWGSGCVNNNQLITEHIACHNKNQSIVINVPPLGVSIWKLDKITPPIYPLKVK